ETYFFRDAQHYEWLGRKFLPEIAATATQKKRRKSLRIWSAACSTGEEPYAIALEYLAKKPLFAGWPVTILGTDLSGAALSAARTGSYDARAIRLVDPARREAFFDLDKASNRWVIRPEVKSLVTWKRHNLLSELAEEPFDCIF